MFITYCYWVIHNGYLSLKEADNKQSNFANELNNFEKGKKHWKKVFIIT